MPLPRLPLWPHSLAGKAGGVVVALLAVLGVAYGAAAYFTAARLAAAVAECERRGFSFDLDALLGPDVLPEENAVFPLDQAAPVAARCTTAAMQKHNLSETHDGPRNAAYLAEFTVLLADPEYEPLLADADRRPSYHTRDPFVRPLSAATRNMDLVNRRRSVARAEHALALHLTNEGRRTEAARRMVRLLRLTRKWQDKESFRIFAMVNIATREVAFEGLNAALRGPPLTKVLHAEIDAELARQEEIRAVLPWVLRSETVFTLDALDQLPTKRPPFGRLLRDAGRTHLLETARRLRRTCDLPYPAAVSAIARLASELDAKRGTWLGGYLTLDSDSLLSSVKMTRSALEWGSATARCLAKARCLRVVNAWAAKGDFNADLQALGLPATTLVDPVAEGPLRIRRLPRGPIIYSVGGNLADDGGKVDSPSQTDIGFGPVLDRPVPQ